MKHPTVSQGLLLEDRNQHLVGIYIRAAEARDASAMARVYVDSSRSAFARIVPSQFLENLSYRKAEKRWCRVLGDNQHTKKYYVAETQAAKVVGLAGGGPERDNDPMRVICLGCGSAGGDGSNVPCRFPFLGDLAFG